MVAWYWLIVAALAGSTAGGLAMAFMIGSHSKEGE
jgi:hypothetical protein